jgi:hypothetical protein
MMGEGYLRKSERPTHVIGLPKVERLVIECGQCGDDVTLDQPHECPVGGNTVTIEPKAVARGSLTKP